MTHNRTLTLIAKASLVLLVWALYSRTLAYDFAYDDYLRIIGDNLVRAQTITWDDIRIIFITATYPGDLFRPMSTLLHRAVHVLFGLDALAYHLMQILLHSVCTLLALELFLACRLSLGLAWSGAAWFAVHPINVEAVANPSGQPELLALASAMLALFASHAGAQSVTTLKRLVCCILSALLFGAAVLAKESAFVFLALIPLTGWYRGIALSRLAYTWLWLLLVAVCVLALRKAALGDQFLVRSVHFLVSENPLLHGALGFQGRLLPATVVFGDYITQLLLPISLSADYSIPPPLFWARVFSLQGIMAASIPIVLLLFVIRHRSKPWGVFGFWFFFAFSLTLNIITPIGTVRGDRLAYAPSLGFCVFILGLFSLYLFRKRHKAVFATAPIIPKLLVAALLGLSAWLASQRIPVWKNQDTLFLATAMDAPQSPKAIENAGAVWFDSMRNPNIAEQHFKKALQLDPTRVFSMKYMVNINLLRGNLPEARAWCLRILKERPEDGEILAKIAQIDSALEKLSPAAKP